MSKLAFNNTPLDITSNGEVFTASADGQAHQVEVLDSSDGRLSLRVDGRHLVAYISSDGRKRWITVAGRTFVLTKSSTLRGSGASHDGSSELAAPMPGQVRAVNVEPGDAVTKGQVLLVLEAMKMEIRLQAPFDGLASSVDAKVGQTVEREQILIKLQKPQAAQS